MSIGIGKYISAYSNPQMTKALNTSYERLSSGQRINRSSDDAAGVAVAESLSSKSRVFKQGIRNFEDGNSLLALADSAIAELTNIATRITELAEQAANGVINNSQRSSLDAEAQALKKEYSRIIQTTKFNGQKVLSSDLGALKLQGGYDEAGAIQSTLGGKVSTGAFTVTGNLTGGGSIRTVESGDFNGDGALDLVSSNHDDDEIGIMLGNGDGTFASMVSYAAGNGTISATAADFNGDGILDVATANNHDDNVSVLIGRGDGTFRAAVSYAAGDGARWVEAADFNNDGFLDLATVNEFAIGTSGTGTSSVLLGRGDGTFNAAVSYDIGDGARAISAGDFNGDGAIDLVAANQFDNNISVLTGRGDGTFQNEVTYATGVAARNIAIGNFDGNNTLDLAVTNMTDGTVSIFSGSGTGTFTNIGTLTAGNSPRGIDTGDFNGDGNADLVVANEGDDSVIFFSGNGDGSFTIGATTTGTGDSPLALVAKDFNGDGVLDLATANEAGDSVSTLISRTTAGTATLLDFSLKTLADARQALPVLNRKVSDLATQRGQIGAFQSRLGFAKNNLQTQAQNFTAAESLIRDADIAAESANLIKYSIKQKGEVAIQAQANQNAGVVLALLS
jgi:flagellin-like hook-associated protein FlgL